MSPESKFPFGNVSNFSNGCQSKKKHTHFQTMSETASFLLKAHEYEENGPPLSSRYFYKVNDFHLLVLKVFSKELSEQIDNAVENDLSNFYFSGTGDVEFRSSSGTKVTVKNSSRRNRMGTRSYERILQDNMTLKENKEILISENHMYVLVRDSRDTKWKLLQNFVHSSSFHELLIRTRGDRSWGMPYGMEGELNLRRALNQYCDSMVTRPDSKGQQSYVDVTCNITRSQDQCRDHALAGLNRVDLSKTDNAVARHRLNKKTLKDFYGGQGGSTDVHLPFEIPREGSCRQIVLSFISSYSDVRCGIAQHRVQHSHRSRPRRRDHAGCRIAEPMRICTEQRYGESE